MNSPDTSAHFRQAIAGDMTSLGWLVERISPVLVAQAAWRLGPRLRRHHDPEDLVEDAWLTALPRLESLPDREGRLTPVLLRFLSTTIVNRVNNLARKHLRGRASEDPVGSSGDVTAPHTGVVTAAVRAERSAAVAEALDDLEPTDREIIFLRGIEQRSNLIVSELLGITEAAASMRFHRALSRLKGRLPGSLFWELE